eukprot:CAMPEP_0183379038 /NCGR_PEP_ID=MMETSP0164_2-20130417/125223_1 /TAXON_ID=221442 /ORGANISM="Coccolithus pelagicus ssp braarudi, Strain PLY182g" /LENGTH=553 /DNA_ID=CAMNT_0025556615 /DNA_START=33 /DNA_END=1694 /DNA_ORIENTATION=-
MLKAEAVSRYPSPAAPLAYGTAGFRARAELLEGVFYRMGMLAALRSRALGGLAVGLMVTASHNPERDNGVKLIDTDGGMLAVSWEKHASELANAPVEQLNQVIASIVVAEKCDAASVGTVLLGRDTRPHSEKLSAIALEGVGALGAAGRDLGLLSTPQLHHLVRMTNGEKGAGPYVGDTAAWNSEQGYYTMLADAFSALLSSGGDRASCSPLWADAAHGVGAPKLEALLSKTPQLQVAVANTVGTGPLNDGCGAEHVQKARLPPRGYEAPLAGRDRAASLDGDADRIVYHYWTKDGSWRLLDGDKICALFVGFIAEQLDALALEPPISLAAVQTAYANGASGRFVKSLGVPVAMAKTGVKYLHHVALENELSVYFEANGHGTVLFSDRATSALLAAKAEAEGASDEARALAAGRLLLVRQLVNQAIGDALSDLLLVEAILALRGWGAAEWDGLYEDLPSRQSKLPVKDRTAITTTPTEERLTSPLALQSALDSLMAECPHGRCFVRPSGTEDVVRVYAEAATQADADALALRTAQATWELAGGVGEKPTGAAA